MITKILIKVYWTIDLILFYIYDLVISSFKVALDVVTRKDLSKPRLIEYKTGAKTELELTVLANLITFSPGTIIADISDDKKTFLLHVMFSESDKSILGHIENNIEKRILRVLR
ncbi:Na+/H+ antiporter subunit E [bacterium]|nr:Na+/H+ antiporter subunit E [bacterium]